MHNRDANEFMQEIVIEFESESLSEFVFKADQTQTRTKIEDCHDFASGMREYLKGLESRLVHDF